MGLFEFTDQKSPYTINKKEETGRFIPVTIIKNSTEQSKFITNMIPLLHLPADKTDAIKYTVFLLDIECLTFSTPEKFLLPIV